MKFKQNYQQDNLYTVAVKTFNKQSKNNVNVPYMDVSLSISKSHTYEIDSEKVHK